MSTRRLLAALACLPGLLTLAACGEDPTAPGEDAEPLLISAAERGDLPAIDPSSPARHCRTCATPATGRR